MSRQLLLEAQLSNKELFVLVSLFTGDETARTMIVSASICTMVTPPFPDTELGRRLGEFRAWLDSFMEGAELSVSEDPFNKPPDTMLARVSPVEEDFWSIRVTEPEESPGIRGFGGFHKQDEFVALTFDYREDIGDFSAEVDAVREAWTRFFGVERPFHGDELDEYLTNYIVV